MKWNRGAAPGAITKLLMGSALPHLDESQFPQDGDDFSRFQDREMPHESGNRDILDTNKL